MNRKSKRSLPIPLIVGGAVVLLLILAGAIWVFASGSGEDEPPPIVGPAVPGQIATGLLNIQTDHPVTIQLDGQPWSEDQPVPAGRHTLVLKADGYDDMEKEIDVAPDSVVTLRGSLVDSTIPQVKLRASPTISEKGEVVKVSMHAFDPASRPARVVLVLDGMPVLAQPFSGNFTEDSTEAILTELSVGLHRLEMTVLDKVGNAAIDDLYIEVVPSGGDTNASELFTSGFGTADGALVELTGEHPTDDETSGGTLNEQPEIVTSAGDTLQPSGSAQPVIETEVGGSNVSIVETSIEIPTYAYADALFPSEGFVYPVLDAALVGEVQAKTYHAVVLENDALRLTILPELGGRLYQIIDKATGSDLLYNNPVVKPTRWGPEEMNWWLAVGGMEWAFPVEEHGYAWGMIWKIDTRIDDQEGAGVATLSYHDPASELTAEIKLTLPASGRSFTLEPTLINETDQSKQGQLWVDAALHAGEGMAVLFPAQQIQVHSADDTAGFAPGEQTNWLDAFGRWGQWGGWFSAFAAPTSRGELTAWGAGSGPGLKRTFDPVAAPGVKFFTWGPEGDLAEFEGTPYFEVWGGLTPNFESTISLEPGTSRSWVETWTVLERN